MHPTVNYPTCRVCISIL